MDCTNDDLNDNEDDTVNYNDNNDDILGDNHLEDTTTRRRVYQHQPLPLLSHSRSSSQDQQMSSSILSSRLSPDINALNISSSNVNLQSNQYNQRLQQQQQQQHRSQSMDHQDQHQQQHSIVQHQPTTMMTTTQYHHHQQGKRDILLKIRHQIFERKRLREKGYEPQALNVTAAQVWRPW